MRKIIGYLLAAMLLLMLPLGFSEPAHAAVDYSNVRVQLSIGSVNMLSIPVSGSYFIAQNGASFKNGTLSVQASGGTLSVSHSSVGTLYSGSSVSIMRESITPSAGYLRLTTSGVTRSFLGHLTLKCSGGLISAINEVPLPHYLYGVVGFEMSNTFPYEALKAQAVAAKCYVLANMTGGGGYDISDTSSDQVYKGYVSSYTNVIRAVDETYDMGLYLGNQILSSYYAASNGGATLLPSDVWGGTNRYQWDRAYGRVQDPYDVANPLSVSETTFFPANGDDGSIKSSLSNYLRLRPGQVGHIEPSSFVTRILSIDSLRLVGASSAEIALTLQVQRSDGTQEARSISYNFSLDELRWNGIMTLSQNLRLYTVTPTGGGYNVTRSRYGHGVGLSQRGAQQMANSGFRCEQILQFYYPGATIRSMGIAAPSDPTKPLDQLSPSAPPTGEVIAFGEVTSSTLNFRSAPNTSGKILKKLTKGDRLEVYSSVKDWYYCTSNGVSGYASGQYLKLSAPAASPPAVAPPSEQPQVSAPFEQATTGVIRANTSLLTNPSAYSGGVLGELSANTTVSVLAEVGDYYAVQAGQLQGYVQKEYVSLASSPQSSQPAAGYGETTGKVNFRTGPSTGYSIIKELKKGTKLTVYGITNGWYYVEADGISGYLNDKYVKLTASGGNAGSAPAAPAQPSGEQAWSAEVVNEWVRLRSTPSADNQSNILGDYDVGTKLIVHSQTGSFYFVTVDGRQGYMHKDFVKITGELSQGASSQEGVTTASVNLRTGPSTGHTILTKLKKGTKLYVLGSSGDWYNVQSGSLNGYIIKKYAKLTSTAATAASTASSAKTTANVNMRKTPSTSSSKNIITLLKKGTALTLLGKDSGFYLVSVNGKQGYVSTKYIK